MSANLKPKTPITNFLHHKVIINQDQKKPFIIYAGLEGRVIAVEDITRNKTLYQIHFSKAEAEIKSHPELNDIWFTKEQFSLTK